MDRLLTIEDLAARWSVDTTTVLEHVRNDGLKFIPVGIKPKDKSRPGAKNYRFLVQDVLDWERARRMSWPTAEEIAARTAATKAAADAAKPATNGKPQRTGWAGWDGVDRMTPKSSSAGWGGLDGVKRIGSKRNKPTG